MDLFEAIHERRSIREYVGEPVTDEQVEIMLRAAMAAPSAGNQQVWHFVVIRNRETLHAVTSFHPYAKMLDQAWLAIAIVADTTSEKYRGYWVQDLSAAMQNLLLAAHGLGLGAVWLGVHPMKDREEGMRKVLSLPEGVECLGLAAIGHPATPGPGRIDRFDPARIHHETW